MSAVFFFNCSISSQHKSLLSQNLENRNTFPQRPRTEKKTIYITKISLYFYFLINLYFYFLINLYFYFLINLYFYFLIDLYFYFLIIKLYCKISESVFLLF